MAIQGNIGKTRKDIESTVTDPTPLYAIVGIGDVAVATVRNVRSEVSARAARLDTNALREQAKALVTARVTAVQSDVKAAPGQVKALQPKAQALLDGVVSSARSTYDDLANRGKSLVTRVRKQQATVELEDQAKATVAKVKAASTTTKKAASATKTSAKSTRTTARQSVSSSKTAAKSATTSAKRTATAARKATEAGAAKAGE